MSLTDANGKERKGIEVWGLSKSSYHSVEEAIRLEKENRRKPLSWFEIVISKKPKQSSP